MRKKISDQINRKFIESYDIDEWEIETDTGWVDIVQLNKTIEYEKWKIVTEFGLELICADDHIVFTENFEEIFIKDLIPNESKIQTKNGIETVISVENLHIMDHMYDIGVNSENSRYYTNNILSHNSITTVAYVLWATVFNSNYNVALLANKGSLAKELLDRYQKCYASLPKWLQQGVVAFNKMSVELENGSKIIAAATSSTAIRGGSFSCVVLDEYAHVSNNIAEEFFTSVYPVISSGMNSKIIVISTSKGMNHYYKLFTDAIAKRNDYFVLDIPWTRIPGRDQKWKEEYIRNTSVTNWMQEIESLSYDTIINIDGKNIKIGDFYNSLK